MTNTDSNAKVLLMGKIHDASSTRWIRDGGGNKVPQPNCGQRSRTWYPSVVSSSHETTCEKCLNKRG